MPSTSVREAVHDAFDEKTREAFGDKYLELIYVNWSEAVRSLRRTFLLLVVTVVTFLILEQTHSGTIDLGPFQVDDFAAVLTLIPVMSSFLIFEGIDLAIADHYYKEAASATMKAMHPSIYENKLQLLLEPTTSFALGMGSVSSLKPKSPGRLGQLREDFEMLTVIGLLLGALGFIVYAFASLYTSNQTSWPAVTISLCLSLFNLARGALALATAMPDIES
jgi:hypothetical protein